MSDIAMMAFWLDRDDVIVRFSLQDFESEMSKDLVALVTGYTGESGKALLKELIGSHQFKKIILVGRRQVDFTDDEYNKVTVEDLWRAFFF